MPPLRLPVCVSRHALDTACLRSPELAHVDRRRVLEDARREIEAAIASGRVSIQLPQHFAAKRAAGNRCRFALSADGERAWVIKLVESAEGVAWLALTLLVRVREGAAA